MNDRPATWRPMQETDLDAVVALADRCHPDLPEERAVFAERLALHPAGCLVLEGPGGIDGYAVAHPIRAFAPPALGARLGAIDDDADQFYLHDVVVTPERRGSGASAEAIRLLLEGAATYPTAALVSVYGTAGFWSRFGFRPAEDVMMAEKLRPYGPGAVFMVRPSPGVRATKEERPPSA